LEEIVKSFTRDELGDIKLTTPTGSNHLKFVDTSTVVFSFNVAVEQEVCITVNVAVLDSCESVAAPEAPALTKSMTF
jgi:hypothetical protein